MTKSVQAAAVRDSRDGDATPERWFLDRGLPAALTARERARHFWSRSAPALAAYATVIVALLVVYLLTGTSEVYIDGAPTPSERLVLAVIASSLPMAALIGWRVSKLRHRRAQSVVSTIAALIAAAAGVVQGGWSHLVVSLAVVALVGVLTATGAGAVIGWAVGLTMTQVVAMGGLLVRSLPVLLLTVVVFFNSYVWLMASAMSRTRLWMVVLLLVTLTAAFIVSASASRITPMLESLGGTHEQTHTLEGTPFARLPDPSITKPLSAGERVNVIVVLAAAQIAHLLMVAVCTAAVFFVLGLMVLSPTVLARWSANGTPDGTILGMTIPVPQSLIHVTLFLCALTLMYVSARSVGDDEYKRNFLAPLIEDLHETLIARNRYRSE